MSSDNAYPQLEAEDPGFSTDSAYEDDELGSESTASLTSAIYQYRKEHGRTYHAYKDGQYAYPNDEIEMDRLDLQHCVFLMSLDGKLHLAPISAHPQNVLDVGTGTGLWAMDFADLHPSAQVLGIDLSPIQSSFVPPNITFQVDDANEPWTFRQKFDLVFCRQLHYAVEERRLIGQAFNSLVPGGWLEMQELCLPVLSDDGSLKPDSALARCYFHIVEACQKIGQNPAGPTLYSQWMEDAGFINVTTKVIKWPSNSWPEHKKEKKLGIWTQENVLQGLEGFTMALFTRLLDWKAEEVQVFLADVRKDIKNDQIKAYWPLYIVYGQKALA